MFASTLFSKRLARQIGLAGLIISLASQMPAQPGTLDSDFGLNGIVITALDTLADRANALAIQPDGKIILGGSTQSSFTEQAFALLRYHPDGRPDSSFGSHGVVRTAVETRSAGLVLALQPDGKIILAGHSKWYLNMARYHPDGSLDTAFGNGGIVITDIDGYYNDRARAIALQADGKILLGGYSQHFSNDMSFFLLARYQPDGTIDSSFGTNGHLIGRQGEARAMGLQADGKIILGGSSELDFALERYLPDGTVDTGFGQNGKVTTSVGGTDKGYALGLQDDGKILLGGVNHYGFLQSDFTLLRYQSDGSPDPDFGTNGVVTSYFGAASQGYAMQLQADGSILLAGEAKDNNGLSHMALARFQNDGAPDQGFGNGGKMLTPIGNDYSAGMAIGLASNGHIVLGGFVHTEARLDMVLAQYEGVESVGIADACCGPLISRIYPHPIQSTTTLEFRMPLQDASLHLYNANGQLIRQRDHIFGRSVQLERGGLPSGIYMLLLSRNGEGLESKRLLIGR